MIIYNNIQYYRKYAHANKYINKIANNNNNFQKHQITPRKK